MRMTSKGQVTIPEAIRNEFGLFPGCDLKFLTKKNKIYITLTSTQNTMTSRFEKVKNTATIKLSTKQIMNLTRGV